MNDHTCPMPDIHVAALVCGHPLPCPRHPVVPRTPHVPAFPSYPPGAELARPPRRVPFTRMQHPSSVPVGGKPTVELTEELMGAVREPAPERWCTPCALERDRRVRATHVVNERGAQIPAGMGCRPMQWWSCGPCTERDLASGKVVAAMPLDEWFDAARTKWDAEATVACLKGRPAP